MPIKRGLFIFILVCTGIVAILLNVFLVPMLGLTTTLAPVVKGGVFVGLLLGMIGFINKRLKSNQLKWLRR
ncbi:MAG: hypothetical protein ACRBF0_05470 [Calditrichia bacterium]